MAAVVYQSGFPKKLMAEGMRTWQYGETEGK